MTQNLKQISCVLTAVLHKSAIYFIDNYLNRGKAAIIWGKE